MSSAVPASPMVKGHQLSKGNRGPWRSPITHKLVSQLNEVWDKKDPDSMTKMDKLVEQLIGLAIGVDREVPLCKVVTDKKGQEQYVALADEKGKPRTVIIPGVPDLSAIKEVADRVEGKVHQKVTVDGGEHGASVTLIFGNDVDPHDLMMQYEEIRRNAGHNAKLIESKPADDQAA